MAPFNIAEQDDEDARSTPCGVRDRQQSFEQLAAFQFQTAIVGPKGEAVRYTAAAVTGNTFRLLKVVPALGRDFTDDDSRPGAAPVVIIGDQVWDEQFSRSPRAVGQSMRVNGTVMTVVAVMPPKFAFPDPRPVAGPIIDPQHELRRRPG
jgi:hypothetical protein